MKELLLLRHAKSSWSDPGLSDFDRPLNGRGKRDAPRMGRVLADHGLIPQQIFTSTAERARTTADLVADAAGFSGELIGDDDLYHAAGSTLCSTAAEAAADSGVVMIVAHNPGMEDLVSALSGEWHRFPTAALAHFRLPIETWAELTPFQRAELVHLWRPKELADDL